MDRNHFMTLSSCHLIVIWHLHTVQCPQIWNARPHLVLDTMPCGEK